PAGGADDPGRRGVASDVVVGGGSDPDAAQSELLANTRLDFGRDLLVLLQEGLCVLAALAEADIAVGEPSAGLVDDVGLHAEIDQQPGMADPLVEHDVELGLPERRSDLVLDDLDAGAVPDLVLAVLDRADPADVETEAGVELERPAARRRLRVPEHDPDLLPDLVREDDRGLGTVHRARQLPQRLAHEAGLEADVRVAHLAFDLGPGHQRRDRVHDDHVDRAAPNQDLRDLERLLPRVRLADQQVLHVDAELARVLDVQRVLRVDERRDAALLLRVRDHVQTQRRLPARLRTEDLGDPATGDPTDPDRRVQVHRTGRDRLDHDARAV